MDAKNLDPRAGVESNAQDELERKRAKFEYSSKESAKSVESLFEPVTARPSSAPVVRKTSLRTADETSADMGAASPNVVVSKVSRIRDGILKRGTTGCLEAGTTSRTDVAFKETAPMGKVTQSGSSKSLRSGDEAVFVPAKFARNMEGRVHQQEGSSEAVGAQISSDDFREYFARATGLVEQEDESVLVVADSGQESAVSPRRPEDDGVDVTVHSAAPMDPLQNSKVPLGDEKQTELATSFPQPSAAATRATRRVRTGRYGIASKLILSFREVSPDCISVHHAALTSHFIKKDFAAARKTLETLIHLHPDCQIYRFNLGLTLKVGALETLRSFRPDPKRTSGRVDEKTIREAIRNAIREVEVAHELFEIVLESGQDAESKEMLRAAHEAKACSDILVQTAHLAERSESCSSLGSSGRTSIGRPLTYGELTSGDDVPVRRRMGSGSQSFSGKREAVAQRGSDKKEKLVKRQQETAAVKKRSRKSAQLEEHYSLTSPSLPPEKQVFAAPVVEPQRKRARAVKVGNELAERRKKRVANRKRRELEIEKSTQTSSDDETVVISRPPRRKIERTEARSVAREERQLQQRASLTSDSDGLRNDRKQFVRRSPDREALVAESSTSKPSRPEVPYAEVLKASSLESATNSEVPETDSENKSSAGESDESVKRAGAGSELDGKPRKRKTLVHLN